MKKPLIIMMALAAGACGAEEPGQVGHPEDPASVTVSLAVETPDLQTFPATIVAVQEASLATRMAGTILDIPVDVGDRVNRGDTLVVLDAQDIQARIAAAQANLELARKSHDRVERLARDGAASQQELDQAVAALAAAEAAVRDARAQGSYGVLTAPFSGTVTMRMSDPGDLAAPGRPIVVVTGRGGVEVEADLPGELAGRVGPGDLLTAILPGEEGIGTVKVTRVSPALTPGSRRFRVEGQFEAGGFSEGALVPGRYIRLGVPRAGTSVQWVPLDALVARGQLRGVYAVEGEELRLHWVRIGEVRGEAVELLAGPGSDMRIVRNPAADLYDGRPVGAVTSQPWEIPGADGTGDSGEEVAQ
jgi:RND family efflux transporter MFP subunit